MRHFYTCRLHSLLLVLLVMVLANHPIPMLLQWIDDLGRLTPFGRTFDVYIQTGLIQSFHIRM